VLSQNELNKQLWDAAQAGNAATVSTLLQQGADATTATASGETALHAAVAAGSLPAVIALIDKGANVNAVTASGWTPLHHAARFGRADAANYLLKQGANPKAVTKGTPAKTPVQMAMDKGDMRTARILGY
jgi:ankyrin repeat protein